METKLHAEPKPRFLCRNCAPCNGRGCIGQMPGMGGPDGNTNFMLNCSGWDAVRKRLSGGLPEECGVRVALAPMTGAVENVGWPDEQSFYPALIGACDKAGAGLSIGDGCPDEKLRYGIDALRATGKKGAVFIKPYPNDRIHERIDWAQDVASVVGIDIDSYNIETMRNKVHLEKKTASLLGDIQRRLSAMGVPFAVKGVFTTEDIDLVTELRPDIVYVSNHGGRVPARTGSSAEFLMAHRDELLNCCHELWVDGGIRTAADVLAAQALGARQVLVGRPFATALCYGGEQAVGRLAARLRGDDA